MKVRIQQRLLNHFLSILITKTVRSADAEARTRDRILLLSIDRKRYYSKSEEM